MDSSEQLPLFEPPAAEAKPEPPSPPPLLTPRSPLSRALGEFESYMQRRGFTENTQQAFRLDLQILADYLTPVKPLGEISPATLNAFLKWMEGARRISCSPKTLERRITTLKVFFGWLAEMEYLPKDAAAPLIHHSITAPLADILNDAQLEAALAVTQSLRQGGQNRKPDARPHLLLTLILHTGIKKSECVALQLNHLELDAANPALWVRYKQSNRRHKERRIALPTWWPAVLQEYLDQQQPQQFLFPCTARNLEYVLTDAAKQAELPNGASFESMRWTCAFRDYRDGMTENKLQEKLGLSSVTFRETLNKLGKLIAQQEEN